MAARGKPQRGGAGVRVLVIAGTDSDGDLIARFAEGDDAKAKPIYVVPMPGQRSGGPALKSGDRVLARVRRLGDGSLEASPIKRLAPRQERVIGVFERVAGKGRLLPTDKRVSGIFSVADVDAMKAEPGDIVIGEIAARRRQGLFEARITQRLGHIDDPGAASEIAIAAHDIPVEFPPAAIALAKAAEPAPLGRRDDLRQLPLVTIDDVTARDFDDAVWAAADDDPSNPGGWRLVVAIADVAWYVRPNDALDRSAAERGNSVYFPDRVVPMLPEALSNGLCSLKPKEDRACLAVEIVIDSVGEKRRHRFMRAMMRSAARLTYDAVQHAADGHPDKTTEALLEPVIAPLFGAFRALLVAREKRGTIDLDLPEREVAIGPDGRITHIRPRPRLDSHRLIEGFMIIANVCAAETLEEHRYPCVYRVHDSPAPDRVDELREILAGLGLKLAKGQVLRPHHFAQILDGVRGTAAEAVVHRAVLRTQARAEYSLDNPGHFGLALRRYAHFTSPIRRYADLLVHRALIAALKLGPGGLTRHGGGVLEEAARHVSATERKATAAEREAVDRLTAAFLARAVGENFSARISAVTRYGVFVTLDETGADGLVPSGWVHAGGDRIDLRSQRLIRRGGATLSAGEPVTVRLEEADRVTGGLVFSLVAGGDEADETPREPPARRGGRATGPGRGHLPAKGKRRPRS